MESIAAPQTQRLVLPEADRALLEHHRVDGVPTVPGAMLLDLAARYVLRWHGGQVITALSAVRFTRYLRYRGNGRLPELSITAEPLPGTRADGSDTVRVTIATPTPVRQLPCAATTVHLSRHRPPPVHDEPPPPGDGAASVDPYLRPGSPVALSGPFDVLLRPRRSSAGGAAGFRIPPGRLGSDHQLPILLLDGLIRIQAQTAGVGELLAVAVPTGIDRVDVRTWHNDFDLGRVADGIVLRHHPGAGTVTASGPDGVLLRLHGLATHPLGWYHAGTRTWYRHDPGHPEPFRKSVAR